MEVEVTVVDFKGICNIHCINLLYVSISESFDGPLCAFESFINSL